MQPHRMRKIVVGIQTYLVPSKRIDDDDNKVLGMMTQRINTKRGRRINVISNHFKIYKFFFFKFSIYINIYVVTDKFTEIRGQ